MTAGIYWFDASGNNITLEYSADLTASPLVYTPVEELKSLSRNPEASPEIDFTHYGSTEQELKLGLARRGGWDAGCNFVPTSTSQVAVIALDVSKAERWWRITYPLSNTANSTRSSEVTKGYVQTAAIAPPGATDTNPADFNFTLRAAGSYSFTAEAA